MAAHDILGSPDVSSLADIAASFEQVNKLSAVPVTKANLVPPVLVALVPLVGVALTQAPFTVIVGALKALFLL